MGKKCWPVKATERGTSLIEALIALLLMGIALLGFALMQMETLQANSESYARTEARILLIGMAERIQANSEGKYLGGSTKEAEKQTGITSNDALAAHDVWAWQQELTASRLSSPVGNIAGNNSLLELTVSWQAAADKGSASDTDAQTLNETLEVRVAP